MERDPIDSANDAKTYARAGDTARAIASLADAVQGIADGVPHQTMQFRIPPDELLGRDRVRPTVHETAPVQLLGDDATHIPTDQIAQPLMIPLDLLHGLRNDNRRRHGSNLAFHHSHPSQSLTIGFMMNWFAAHWIELAMFLVTLVVTVVGWITEHGSAKRLDAERRNDIDLLTRQVNALQTQAESLREQTDMQRAEYDKPPFSDAEWVTGSIRRVRITGPRRVHVESVSDVSGSPYAFRVITKVPDDFEPTETIEYVSGPGPIEFRWRWADEPDMELRSIRKVVYKPRG